MIVEKEFKKTTGNIWLYGYVKINANHLNKFSFTSTAKWPLEFDDVDRYEDCIRKGIMDTLVEHGFSTPFGSYVLKSVKVTEDMSESSVPIAYYFATKDAIRLFIESFNQSKN
jgi:hypothetical protein